MKRATCHCGAIATITVDICQNDYPTRSYSLCSKCHKAYSRNIERMAAAVQGTIHEEEIYGIRTHD